MTLPGEPWALHEDADLLAALKPSGVNTHRPDRHAQEGLVEWVAARRPGVAPLHRLDKETSGLLLLARSPAAHRVLGGALAAGGLEKRYLLLCAADTGRPERLRCQVPAGRPRRGEGPTPAAETELSRLERRGGWELWEARPRTGRTHQIRVHAANLGLPIAGDAAYGGPPGARLFLHAAALRGPRPAAGPGGAELALEAPLPEAFRAVLEEGLEPTHPRVVGLAALEARVALLDPATTQVFVWADRDHDGVPGLRIERLGEVALVLRFDERPDPLSPALVEALLGVELPGLPAPRAVVERRMPRRGPGSAGGEEAATLRLAGGTLLGARFTVQEQGLTFLLDLEASPTSTGLFLDQRETRRRLLGLDLRGKSALNAFAHTGSLSVAAARAGATVLTLDLSRRYLDWARENLRLNGLDPAAHDFIYGDALEWLARLGKKGRRFDLVLLDPPSFSTTGKGRSWSVERDLGRLVALGAALLQPGGTLYVSTNLRRLPWPRFLGLVEEGLRAAGRVGAIETATLPLDFRSGPQDPPYLKAAWVTAVEA